MALLVNGQPEKTVRVGESYQVPSGAIHDARTGPREQRSLRRTSSKKANRSRRRPSDLPPSQRWAFDRAAARDSTEVSWWPWLRIESLMQLRGPRATPNSAAIARSSKDGPGLDPLRHRGKFGEQAP